MPEDERKRMPRRDAVVGESDIGVAKPTPGDLNYDLIDARFERRTIEFLERFTDSGEAKSMSGDD